jgi:hypothetical protein
MPLDPITGVRSYNIGDLLRLKSTFTSLAGTNVDPTTIVLKVKNPAGSTTTYTYPTHITKESTGVYYYDFNVTVTGLHYFNWAGSGGYQAADEATFSVTSTVFT